MKGKKKIISFTICTMVMLLSVNTGFGQEAMTQWETSEDRLHTQMSQFFEFDAASDSWIIPLNSLTEESRNNIESLLSNIENPSNPSIFNDSEISSMMEQFSANALSGSGRNLSEEFNMLAENYSIDTNKMYSMLNANADYGIVNMKYQSSINSMGNLAQSNSDRISVSSAASIFNSTYGNVTAGIDYSGYQIPEGYSPSKMLSEMSSIYQSAYNGNNQINTVASSIDTASIFSAAKQKISMPSLASFSELSGMTAGAKNKLASASNSKYALDFASVSGSVDSSALYGQVSNIVHNAQSLQTSTESLYKSLKDKSLQSESNESKGESWGPSANTVSNSTISGFDSLAGAGTVQTGNYSAENEVRHVNSEGSDIRWDDSLQAYVDVQTGYMQSPQQAAANSFWIIPDELINKYEIHKYIKLSDPDQQQYYDENIGALGGFTVDPYKSGFIEE